jgi:hypothetical protein
MDDSFRGRFALGWTPAGRVGDMIRSFALLWGFTLVTIALRAFGLIIIAECVAGVAAGYGLVLLLRPRLFRAFPRGLRGPSWTWGSTSGVREWGGGWVLFAVYSFMWLLVIGRGSDTANVIGSLIAVVTVVGANVSWVVGYQLGLGSRRG